MTAADQPDVISALSQAFTNIINAVNTPLGFAVLAMLSLGVLLYFLFHNDSAKVQLIAFGLFLVACLALVFGVFFFTDTGKNGVFGRQQAEVLTPEDKLGNIGCVRVINLDETGGDGFLAVRTSHTVHSAMLDKVYNDDVLYLFERESSWLHIKYARGSDKIDGWVHRSYTENTSCP